MIQVAAQHKSKEHGEKTVNVLRVGDSVFHRAPGGWATAGYYQSKEIIAAFESAGAAVRMRAFGRVIQRSPDKANLIDETEMSPSGVEVPSLGIWPVALNWRAAARGLRAHMQDADVIWATLPTMLGLMAIEVNGGRKPCVVQLVGDPRRSIAALSAKPSTKLLSIAAAYLVRRAISKADGAIFVSQALRSAYLADPRQRAVVVNESRVRNAQIIHQDTLAEVQRASQGACPSLVYVGRLSPEKGVAVLLKALAAVSLAKLTIIGSGPQRDELEGLAARLGIADRVCFLGSYPWGSDLLELIRRHQCLVLPSFTEGLGLVLLESMSQGVPVIASSVGGIPEVVRHGVNGLLFPRGDVSALAAVIDRVISDPGLRYELALAGLCVAKLNTSEIQYGNAVNFILETVALRSSK
jgi:glycosyltransferase involved in cell wall biosynthesis